MDRYFDINIRFTLTFKLILLLPFVLYLIIFGLYKNIPYCLRPKIDTITLPALEDIFTFGFRLQHWPRNVLEKSPEWQGFLIFLDLLAGLVYLLHFVIVWFFVIFLYFFYKKKFTITGFPIPQPYKFLFILGLVNMTAVFTQCLWPTAPPW